MTLCVASKEQPSLSSEQIIIVWLLRLLVPLKGHRNFIQAHGFSCEHVATFVGLEHWLDPKSPSFDAKAVISELSTLHQYAEKHWAHGTSPQCLQNNLSKLKALIGLSHSDCKILEFAVLLHSEPVLNEASSFLGDVTSNKLFQSLSVILGLKESEVRASLSNQGALARSGLVTLDASAAHSIRGKLDLISTGFADMMVSTDADPIHLLRGTVSLAGPSTLQLTDFDHIKASLEILLPYLRHALRTRRSGVNIFIHGMPGTGKSELVRVLAEELACELYEVSSEDCDGDPVKGYQRLCAFRAVQSFFAQRQALIAFDEVEDVFNSNDYFLGEIRAVQNHKAWVNRILEINPVPTIWLSNTCAIDPALIRRFDMVFEMPVPTKKQRQQILQKACGDWMDAPHIARMAEVEFLVPAVVMRASHVVQTIRHDLDPNASVAAFEKLIGNTLQAQGHSSLMPDATNRLPAFYDPSFIHADANLEAVASGLMAVQSGRLCLYGPPGTGKTAYGRWLAKELDMPLLIKRGSDLMSMMVGENEKNIARAFKQAEEARALLMIDEVDSFLQDRRSAKSGWEVTLVNEMLTQMESFSGIFIASTNLMTGIDQAALRRFDLKVKFDYLRGEQAWVLVNRYCEQLNLPAPSEALKMRTMRLLQLTPGDFTAVMRQHRFRPIQSAESLIAALEAECVVKEGVKAPIGFI